MEEIKRLIKKYPFLYPRNEWTDEPVEDFDYTYTILDDMPAGWVKAFGEQMCEEIKQALKEDNIDINEWRIDQLKEKFGAMRLYPNIYGKALDAVINKYEKISAKTCCRCGKPATKISTGWILPWCDECGNKDEKFYKRLASLM